MPTTATGLIEQLCETAGDFLSEATIERDQHLVRNVALLGPDSRNGYRYTQEVMQQAAPLYDGRPVFIDHPEQPPGVNTPGSPLQRKLRDYAGNVVRPRFENNRIRGDLHLIGPNAAWLLNLIESAPRDIGMSHVVLARRNAAGTEVAHIDKVLSVDIVAFPATTQSFQEGLGIRDQGLGIGQLGIRKEEVLACGGACPIPNPQSLIPDLRQLVEQSRIPPVGRTDALYQLLQACPDPRQVLTLIETYWRHALAETPRSAEKLPPDQAPPLAVAHVRRALMAAIRGE
jgi:hypothetical protein